MKINLKSYNNLSEMINITLREEIDETADEEWKSILQYAIDHGVIYCENEIHCILAEMLLISFMDKLSGMVDNSKCMGLDTTAEEELIDTLRDILEEM